LVFAFGLWSLPLAFGLKAFGLWTLDFGLLPLPFALCLGGFPALRVRLWALDLRSEISDLKFEILKAKEPRPKAKSQKPKPKAKAKAKAKTKTKDLP